MMDPTQQFTLYVRDALASLYDPPHMEMHPLIRALALDREPASTHARALRERLIAAIELLRPDGNIAFHDPAWLGYRVLRERYIEAQHPRDVCSSLGISRTTFYRYHREALDALTSILWEQRAPVFPEASPGSNQPAPADDSALEEALRVARSSDAQRLDLAALMRDMHSMITLVARRTGGDIVLDVPDSLPSVWGNATILRQIVLNLLAEVYRSTPNANCQLGVTTDGETIRWYIGRAAGSFPSEPSLRALSNLKISQALLETYGGALWFEHDQENCVRICFSLPVLRPRVILIVDDNPELTALYSRYLARRGHVLHRAHSAQDVERYLKQNRPDLVLLDVLMPNEDGWLVLRKLKESPETAAIPVVICSVLDQPDVATALGAEAVLQKPVFQEQLLELVDRLLGPHESP